MHGLGPRAARSAAAAQDSSRSAHGTTCRRVPKPPPLPLSTPRPASVRVLLLQGTADEYNGPRGVAALRELLPKMRATAELVEVGCNSTSPACNPTSPACNPAYPACSPTSPACSLYPRAAQLPAASLQLPGAGPCASRLQPQIVQPCVSQVPNGQHGLPTATRLEELGKRRSLYKSPSCWRHRSLVPASRGWLSWRPAELRTRRRAAESLRAHPAGACGGGLAA